MRADSVAGIATRYGLDGPGIESRWGGEILHSRPDRPWGPTSLLYNGYWVFQGTKRPGLGANHPPPSSPDVFVVCSRVNFTLLYSININQSAEDSRNIQQKDEHFWFLLHSKCCINVVISDNDDDE